MKANPGAIRILCYGDSNTWGDPPVGKRYPSNVRWTGQLQEKLGESFEILEEGLCGRTTALDDPKEEGRNGATYLAPCLQTHNPLDIVILMLGTNDLKERFDLSPQDVARNIEKLIRIIKNIALTKDSKEVKIILLSPPLVKEYPQNILSGIKGAGEKSKQLGNLFKRVTEKYGCNFINIAEFVEPSKIDGCHLDPASNAKIAEVLDQKIKAIVGSL
jgi:lysophospholipase L1-like esterase